MGRSILLFSGGIDSYVAWHYLGQPKTVYFDIKAPDSEREKRVVLNLIPSTIIDNSLNIGDRIQDEKAYLPFRNLFFALSAYKYGDIIWIAGLKDDKVSDKNEEIFEEFTKIMSIMEGRTIRVLSPFWAMTKSDVVSWFLRERRSDGEELLLKTISCYSGDEESNYCGKCPSCFRKWNALYDNGIDLEFHDKDLMAEYYNRALNDHYIPERNQSITMCVRNYLGI